MNPAAIDVPALRAAAQTLEPDRAFAAALAPAAVQPGLMALAGFAAELRNIARVVREPMMGEIRLQWWRDALDAAECGAVTGNPVADALGAAMREHALPKGVLLGVIDGRTADLEPEPWPDARALQTTLAKTEGALVWLAARVLGAASDDVHARELSEVAGAAYGAARNLCDLPLSLSRGHVPLPTADMASQDGLLHDLRSGTVTPAIRVLLDRAASDVRDTLVRAKAGIVARPKAQIAAFLPLVMVEPYLKCVVARGRNPLRDIAEVMPMTRVWRLARASWLRRV